MGIFCKICVTQPPNNEFTPGSSVCGTIKYAFDEGTSVKRISVSLLGHGRLDVTETRGSGDDETKIYDSNKEEYVNLESVVLLDKQGKRFPVGAYETLFHFRLPENVPSSFIYHKKDLTYEIKCKIMYYIKIKFEFTSLFKFNKTFEAEINVVSGITPKLSIEPLNYGERKKLFQLFGKKDNTVILHACINNSVVRPNSQIKVNYEVKNHSNTTVKCVQTKLVEVYTFYKKPKSKSVLEKYEDIEYTNSRTSPIKSGETLAIPLEINIPPGIKSLDHSKIVKRDYAVVITVELPKLHSNMVLFIPVQIGNTSINRFEADNTIPTESPPSYWEAMNECIEKVKPN